MKNLNGCIIKKLRKEVECFVLGVILLKKKNKFTQEGCDWLKHDSLIQHANTKDHHNSIPIAKNQTTIESSFKLAVLCNKLQVIQNMQNVYFLAKHRYATHGLRDLTKLSFQQLKETNEEALFRPFVGIKTAESIINPPDPSSSEYCSYNNDVTA